MKFRSAILMAFLTAAIVWAAGSAAQERELRPPGENCPAPGTPEALSDAWLAYHEEDLCRDLDATFVFHPDGIEVWCRIEDEKSYDKLLGLLAPLKKSYRVEVYARKPEKKKSSDDPPPSFWNNKELRYYLKDPYQPLSPETRELGYGVWKRPLQGASPIFRQRLYLFARQLIQWQTEMEHMAADIPGLTRYFLSSAPTPAGRERARSICRKHAGEVQELAKKLRDNLKHAFPPASESSADPPAAGKSKKELSIYADAVELSREAATAALRVRRFIYPEEHTVGLEGLRGSTLLRSLESLELRAAEFSRTLEDN